MQARGRRHSWDGRVEARGEVVLCIRCLLGGGRAGLRGVKLRGCWGSCCALDRQRDGSLCTEVRGEMEGMRLLGEGERIGGVSFRLANRSTWCLCMELTA